MSPSLFWHLILLICMVLTSSIQSSAWHIEPDDPGGPIFVRDRSTHEVFIFSFEKFSTNTRYQAVISWPGHLPIECQSEVSQDVIYDHRHRHPVYPPFQNQQTLRADRHRSDNAHPLEHHAHRGPRRHLLDTNVNTFRTGNRAKEQLIVRIIVQCHPADELAFKEMVSSGAALAAHRKIGQVHISEHMVEFAIKVESLWFGLIPNSLLTLAIAAVVIFFVVILWVTPFILRNIKPKHE